MGYVLQYTINNGGNDKLLLLLAKLWLKIGMNNGIYF